MKKSWFSIASGIISGIFLFDMMAWLISGKGIAQTISGDNNPLAISIVEHIAPIPTWAFYLVCVACVIILGVILSMCITSSLHDNRRSKG